tara:strand:+ start:835 stop:1185 length:351 start_codon:yes stop_codon:yes gene_type:complete
MATIAKVLLSDSTSGRGIKVVATATAGTDLHTAVSGGSDIDEIWLWASNIHTGAVILTLEWGGATSPDDLFKTVIQPNETVLVAPGWLLNGALDVAAFASVANVISVTGYVNRISA